MQHRPLSFANSKVRNATAFIVLVALCAAALPIPLGLIVRDAKDLSQPFPCQHCACGCKSAEQCWTNCCCYSPAQKAAWAKENGVTPPSYAVLKDESPLAVNHEKVKENRAGSCCSKAPIASKKSSVREQTGNHATCPNCVAAQNVCEREECVAAIEGLESDAKDSETETVLVLSIMAYKCSGQATVFSLLPWAIIETNPNCDQCWELIGRQSPEDALSPIRVFLFPDVPPPRAIG